MRKKITPPEDPKFAQVLTTVNANRGSVFVTLGKNLTEYERYVAQYMKQMEDYSAKAKKVREELKTATDDRMTTADLKSRLDAILRNKKVDWAMLTTSDHLIVQTKMLTRFDALENKTYPTTKVGRYAFDINLNNQHITVFPMDFTAQGYRHPNLMISTNMCWGNAIRPIEDYLRKAEYYSAIDLLVFFFSCYPQDAGSHNPLYWLIWLNERVVEFQQNPWLNKASVYIIGEKKQAKPMKPFVRRVETMMINGVKTNMKDKLFRSY